MTRVAIIGGGIGGLTAASALLRAGAEVSVYEAAGELKEIGAGVALHPNAMRVLRFIGVEDGVRKVAGRSEYAVTRDGITGRLISKTSRARFAEMQGIEPATVHRADLLDVLAAALPDGLVALGKRCVSVDGASVHGGRDVAVARFADGTEAEADVIIGADGIHSAVRTTLFGPDAPRFTGKICYRSVIPTAAVRGGALSDVAADNGQWLGPHGTIVLYPLRGEELINVVAHHDDDSYRHESWVTRCERVRGHRAVRGVAPVAAAAVRGRGDLVQVGAVRPGPDTAVDVGAGHAARRRGAPDAALPGPGRVPGA